MSSACSNSHSPPPPAVKIGCCGFAGSQADYFARFRLVELQQTFYEPPQLRTAERWRATAPPDFEFTLKAWQLITHEAGSPTYRRLRRPLTGAERAAVGSFKPTEAVWQAWQRTRELAAALRAQVIVFQCPASFRPTAENRSNLRRFFARVRAAEADRTGAVPFTFAWEPRGEWSDAAVAELCAELGLVHAVDPFQRRPVTSGRFYFRLHGLTGYGHRYSEAELQTLLGWVRAAGRGWCLFNNVAMREDAARFARLWAGAP